MIFFYKMEAVGNDFVVINCIDENLNYDYKILTKFLCNRKFGVGADGVIFFFKSKIADLKMRIFNCDGSEAEMCGNGIRCLAELVYDKNIVRKEQMEIETLAGIKKINIIKNSYENKIEVNLGEVEYDIKRNQVYLPERYYEENFPDFEIEFKQKMYLFNMVDVGNPHVVCFLENERELDELNLNEVGKFIENYKYFPNKTNVEFAVLKEEKIKARIWERGVGETLACGTGVVAIASVCMKKFFTKSEVIVDIPGGNLIVKKEGKDMILVGDARIVYEGKIE